MKSLKRLLHLGKVDEFWGKLARFGWTKVDVSRNFDPHPPLRFPYPTNPNLDPLTFSHPDRHHVNAKLHPHVSPMKQPTKRT
ncbi:MAG: hypothetical protein IKP44_00890 [Bacteroidaceae bacterium]|nr:hypothetical protein [Bacteroidaceae bacterium]